MTAVIDRTLEVLKWPCAVIAVLLLPGTVIAWFVTLQQAVLHPLPLLPLLGGAVAYAVLWRLLLRRKIFGYFFATLEHELTHAIFAWATFHRVVGIRATWRQGGRITYKGKGNWLITIAPYFFPTACVVLGIVFLLVPVPYLPVVNVFMGVAVVYHIVSTYEQTHGKQTDLQKVGFVFAWMFLPTANLVAYGAVLAFSVGGLRQLGEFCADIFRGTIQLLPLSA